MIKKDSRLYQRHYLVSKHRVAELQANKPFFFLVAKISDQPRIIKKGKVMAHVIPHPTRIVDTEISHAELFEVTGNEETEMAHHHFQWWWVHLRFVAIGGVRRSEVNLYALLPSETAEDHEFPSVDN